MPQKIISWSFYILFLFTPLFFTPLNNELFEYNKMMLVYVLTILITGFWLIKNITSKKLLLKHTPLDIPILFFLISQIFSTIFSVDPHTSWWGYYSRSNGGLLSTISYILLYYALISNFETKQALKFLKAGLFGGFLVSIWGILEHFGVSFSCLILGGQLTASCWVQDVQARVFASLGQPNWLAAYLGMLIFPALYFFVTASEIKSKVYYFLVSLCFYLAFTFTYSRGASFGLAVGGIVFGLSYLFITLGTFNGLSLSNLFNQKNKSLTFRLLTIITVFLISNVIFGSALIRFKNFTTQTTSTTAQQATQTQEITQLEPGGTESGKIRLIVWKGALEIFKHYPVFGSGVETFAYSYYNFRPKEHNLVSEWDFLYNKAHNEYLNYLATTGSVGFISYLFVILSFIFYSLKTILANRSKTKDQKSDSTSLILNISLLAGYISFLVQNFFGFSVVIISLFFYLFPALAFLNSNTVTEFNLKSLSNNRFISLMIKLPFFKIFTITALPNPFLIKLRRTPWPIYLVISILTVGLMLKIILFWFGDVNYRNGLNYSENGNPVRAFRYLTLASKLNPDEPLYASDLGFASAGAAVVAAEQKASTDSAALQNVALLATHKALSISPKNVSIWRTALQTYFQLSVLDSKFEQKTVETVDQTIKLAPTDPKLYYNKALILEQIDQTDQALKAVQQAIDLKPNYREALINLAIIYHQMDQDDKAYAQLDNVLKLIPNDPEVLKYKEQWKQTE